MNIIKIRVMFFKSCFFCFNQLRKIGIKIKISNLEKEYMIIEALGTDEGREALANAMIEPIREGLSNGEIK